MELPKISIITPSFNQGKYIEKTIQSVINQQYPNLEFMIFDGGSTDETVSILKKYDAQINFWESKPDNGQSDAINKGLQRATGDILTWLNSDDQFTEGTLLEIGQFFAENPETYLAHGRTILFGDGYAENETGAPNNDLEILYLSCLPYPQPSSFFRKEAIEEFGLLNVDFHYGMDYDFFVQIALNHSITKLNGVFSKYLLHTNSKSMSENVRFAKDYARIFSKVLRSLPDSAEFIEKMKNLKLYDEGNDIYQVTKKYSEKEIKKAFLYNLKYQLSFYYEDLDMKTCRKITDFLRDFAPEFILEFPELAQINTRSKWLNKPMMQFLRKIGR